MNNFRKFEKIAIRRIALSTFRTTGPWLVDCMVYVRVIVPHYTFLTDLAYGEPSTHVASAKPQLFATLNISYADREVSAIAQ